MQTETLACIASAQEKIDAKGGIASVRSMMVDDDYEGDVCFSVKFEDGTATMFSGEDRGEYKKGGFRTRDVLAQVLNGLASPGGFHSMQFIPWVSSLHVVRVLRDEELVCTRHGVFRGDVKIFKAFVNCGGYIRHRDRLREIFETRGGARLRFSDGMEGVARFEVADPNVAEALRRMSYLFKVDCRGPGESAEHLVFFKFPERMFSTDVSSAYSLVHMCVGKENARAVFDANPDFTFCGENSFSSYTASQIMQLAVMCKDSLCPGFDDEGHFTSPECAEDELNTLLKTLQLQKDALHIAS